jgi:cation transport regulator ChaB
MTRFSWFQSSRVIAKRTIIEALLDEAKDPKKQKASRLRKKQQYSAAVSAALSSVRNKKEIVIDIDGKVVGNNTPFLTSTLSNLSALSDNGDDNRLQNHNLIPF